MQYEDEPIPPPPKAPEPAPAKPPKRKKKKPKGQPAASPTPPSPPAMPKMKKPIHPHAALHLQTRRKVDYETLLDPKLRAMVWEAIRIVHKQHPTPEQALTEAALSATLAAYDEWARRTRKEPIAPRAPEASKAQPRGGLILLYLLVIAMLAFDIRGCLVTPPRGAQPDHPPATAPP